MTEQCCLLFLSLIILSQRRHNQSVFIIQPKTSQRSDLTKVQSCKRSLRKDLLLVRNHQGNLTKKPRGFHLKVILGLVLLIALLQKMKLRSRYNNNHKCFPSVSVVSHDVCAKPGWVYPLVKEHEPSNYVRPKT